MLLFISRQRGQPRLRGSWQSPGGGNGGGDMMESSLENPGDHCLDLCLRDQGSSQLCPRGPVCSLRMMPSLAHHLPYQMVPMLQGLSHLEVLVSTFGGQALLPFPTLNVWWRQVCHIQVCGGLAEVWRHREWVDRSRSQTISETKN